MSSTWFETAAWRRNSRWLVRVYFVVVLGAAAYLVSSNSPVRLNQRDLGTLAHCLPWLLLAHACSCIALYAILCALAEDLSLGLVARAHLRHIPLRYLPGGVWHLVGRLAELKLAGGSSQALVSLPILESLVAILAALGFAGLLHIGTQAQAHSLSLVSGLAVLTWLFLSLHNRLPRKRRYVRAGISVGVALMAMLAFWACLLHAFLIYLKTLGTSLTHSESEFAIAYLLSWVVGHLAIFAPQGLGVSELVFGSLTKGGVEAGLLAGAFRIVLMIGDVVTWVAFSLSGLLQTRANRAI